MTRKYRPASVWPRATLDWSRPLGQHRFNLVLLHVVLMDVRLSRGRIEIVPKPHSVNSTPTSR
jgi:hypothetical protein